jgi:uncharacterized protein YecT (DUF1311 family)
MNTLVTNMKIRLPSVFLALMVPATVLAEQNNFWNMCKSSNAKLLGLQCEEISKICSRVQLTPIPDGDRPSEQEKKEMQGCSSSKLYFGNPSDPIKARKCAYLQIEQGTAGGPFDGIPILMTVYANGDGVASNYDLAMRFACEDANSAAAEYEQRIFHLGTNDSFDYCGDITSGYMQGACADRASKEEQVSRSDKLSKMTARWTEQEKKEFEKLKAIWLVFVEAGSHEVDYTGFPPTANGTPEILQREFLENGFVSSLAEFESGNFPFNVENDFIKADRELNTIYKRIQGASESKEILPGTTKEDIKKAQRAWLKYRDAWVQFAKLKYPLVSSTSWKTWLTRDRVGQLKPFDENTE